MLLIPSGDSETTRIEITTEELIALALIAVWAVGTVVVFGWIALRSGVASRYNAGRYSAAPFGSA